MVVQEPHEKFLNRWTDNRNDDKEVQMFTNCISLALPLIELIEMSVMVAGRIGFI